MNILKKLFSKMFGYMSVVDTQINVYKRFRRRYPNKTENQLLNQLIESRIKSPPRFTSKEEENAHYSSLLDNSNKNLEQVIWEIVRYEYGCFERLSPKKIEEIKRYIKARTSNS